MSEDILVFSDWQRHAIPKRIGTLAARPGRSGELFSFSFDAEALANFELRSSELDPQLQPFTGPQFPAGGHVTFGVFADASPDRWGRTLMRRRFERERREGLHPVKNRLTESDYLLGVHDAFRPGALRFKRDPGGPFLDNRSATAAPPFVRLRELEAATRAIERDSRNDDPQVDAWLKLLLAPGASLGGARPKATVVDEQGHLWIAKFPSVADDRDIGAWELVVQRLAQRCGLNAPETGARRFASERHTFMIRRFDRTADGGRTHFASAMTLTRHTDGDDASSGASYLEIAEVIIARGAQTKRDLTELWKRILFNVLVSNVDDHLRNHGFLLEPGRGWHLSPAFDMNPVPESIGLSLNIDEASNDRDVDLVRSVARYFRVAAGDATATIEHFMQEVRHWNELAEALGIARSERESMASAFTA